MSDLPPAGPRIHERGQRRYTGRRLGEGHAVAVVAAHTLRRILGVGRPARAKLFPLLVISLSYLPAMVFVGAVGLFGTRVARFVPHYADYYSFVVSAIVLFVVFVAPEALCPDRRAGVVALYLVSPLTRVTYLAAKVAAVAAVLAFVTLGPPLVLLAGLALQGAGPRGPGELALVLARILGAGVVLSVFYAAVSTAVSSATDRRGVASTATLLLLTGSGVAAGALVEGMGAPPAWRLVSLMRLPFEVVQRIYGGPAGARTVEAPTVVVVAAAAGVAGVAAAAAVWRYRHLRVTR